MSSLGPIVGDDGVGLDGESTGPAPPPPGASRRADLTARLRAFGRRRRALITVLGSLATAAILGFVLTGRRDAFAEALSSVGCNTRSRHATGAFAALHPPRGRQVGPSLVEARLEELELHPERGARTIQSDLCAATAPSY